MLRLNNLTLDSYGRQFLSQANLTLAPGTKAGLVGLNGVGKSTLFKLILGELHPTHGEISFPKTWRVATVDQEIAASSTPLIDAVLAVDRRRAQLLDSLETAPPEEQGEIHEHLNAIDAHRAPSKAAEILSGLGFLQSQLDRPISEFSGGWRMRAALAGALLAEPELLLLDEPTNYLDLEGALWLESRLSRYPNAALIISHDRDLLNSSVSVIIHMTAQRLDSYTGNYDGFEAARAERARLNAANKNRIEAERAHLQAFVDRFRAKASKAAQAQSRMKRLEKLPPVTLDAADRVAPFILPSPKKSLAPPILRMENAEVGYGQAPILRHISLRINPDDRIGILGSNGAGKSTLAKLLAGALTAQNGEIWRDSRLKVGWFHQHQIEALDPQETPIDLMRRALPDEPEARRRARLGHFGFSIDRAETRCGELSGGERARLLLNMVAMEAPHLLILDEPTNHLDIDSRRALLDALNDYQGAVVLITHDRSLIELIADRLWLVNAGTVSNFDESLDAYAKLVIEGAKNRASSNTESKTKSIKNKDNNTHPKVMRKNVIENKAALAPLLKALNTLEKQIEIIGNQVARIDQELGKPETYAKPETIATLTQDRARFQAALNEAESRWIAAAEQVENAKISHI